MPENETIALAGEVLWRERAMWYLVRRLGGEVVISDREWESVPERPDLILARTDGAMRWVARLVSPVPVKERSEPCPDCGRPCAGHPDVTHSVAAELDGPEINVPLPFPEEP